MLAGTIHAPWFAPNSLSVLCWTYDPSAFFLDRDVPADGGSFECDFSGVADIVGGRSGQAGYLEPDGDMVSVGWTGPYMEVFYGINDGAGGLYTPGHTFWITVTNSAGDVKATGTVTSTADGGWWGGQEGFRPTWTGGNCCDWSPAEPDIHSGDWVYFRSDDGYQNQVQAGAIFGTVDLEDDSVTGPIYASWLTETLEVWCHPLTQYPPEYRQSSAEPDGSVPYFCEWQDPGGGEPWDIQPNDRVFVHYVEPDADLVYRVIRAADGAPLARVFLPLVVKNYSP